MPILGNDGKHRLPFDFLTFDTPPDLELLAELFNQVKVWGSSLKQFKIYVGNSTSDPTSGTQCGGTFDGDSTVSYHPSDSFCIGKLIFIGIVVGITEITGVQMV